jgi:hypothetical protein
MDSPSPYTKLEMASMMAKARVFLDTSAVKHSFRAKQLLRPRLHKFEWNGMLHEIVGHDLVVVDPAARVSNPELKAEIELLSEIAILAKEKIIELLWHGEASTEFGFVWTVPSGGRPELLQVGVTRIGSPIKYSRLLHPARLNSGKTGRDIQIEFLKSIRHPRYMQLQKACGAYQGETINENQLIDAFHVWCAEAGGATHFLTTDLKLARLVSQRQTHPPRVKVVTPSQLLTDLGIVRTSPNQA